MKSISISGSSRTEVGKKATNALRNAGLVPCCIYGVEKDENGNPVTKAFSVPTEGLRKLVYTPDIHVVDLTIDGKAVKAILKDIQFHPVKDTILHVDFYQVQRRSLSLWQDPLSAKVLQTVYAPAVSSFRYSVTSRLRLSIQQSLRFLQLTLHHSALASQSR